MTEKVKLYYVNARLNSATALLSGPFTTEADARETMEIVCPLACFEHPELARATFGIMQCNAPGAGPGTFNDKLPTSMQGNLSLAVAWDASRLN